MLEEEQEEDEAKEEAAKNKLASIWKRAKARIGTKVRRLH